ncbi:MAG: CFI-box-CTERM domain-containing protein [bacterium]
MRVEYELIKQKSGCFIATITCGINSNEVNILQNYRDEILLKFILGRILIKLYYLISPLLVLMIKESIFLKNFVRSFFIIPLIKLIIRKRIQ